MVAAGRPGVEGAQRRGRMAVVVAHGRDRRLRTVP
jgi:hypothetical protein